MVAKPKTRRRDARLLPVLLAALAAALAACDRDDDEAAAVIESTARPEFVGGRICYGCHEAEAGLWQGSQHDLAMQEADAATVLGDFDDAEFRDGDVVTRFFRRDGEYLIGTDGRDGEAAEFVVRQTFGVSPLQQYLVELEDGKVQAFDIAWDSRAADEGGQRWFDLQADEVVDFHDPLHWTGVYLRWNTMCADCHSTDVTKAYEQGADRFETHWTSIDVDCEACHGPGSAHADNPVTPMPALPASAHSWVFESGASIATRVPALEEAHEAEICAQCHSRRSQLTDAYAPGDALLDAYRPAFLTEGLYHADGQILDEVYVYGSFLQSAMAAAGVTCSDCHEPHGATLRAEGNALCTRCHLATTYDVAEHHRHEESSDGAKCTSCHMRAETYMVVDPRRDHSFRVPRPDLSDSLGSPNACNDCHAEQTNVWAAERVAEWFPEGRWNEPHYGEALQAGRSWSVDARTRLVNLVDDPAMPGIARATALGLLPGWMSAVEPAVLARSLEDPDPLVRLAAIEATSSLPSNLRIDLAQRFLTDDLLALRIAAGRTLLTARADLSERRRADLDAAVDEYLAVQAFNGDRPEGALNEATVAADQGRTADAERILLTAIERYPSATALNVNLAEIYRSTGRAAEAEAILRAALDENPDDAAVLLSLGLALVRDERAEEAFPNFERAATLAPDEPYYQYVFALAVNDTGDTERALGLLRATQARFPGHVDTLFALTAMLRDHGEIDEAYQTVLTLNEVLPGDPNVAAFRRELEQRL